MKKTIIFLLFFIICSSFIYAETKVACLGDSVTYGTGVNTNQNFCYLINITSKYQTYNYGIGDEGTIEVLTRINTLKSKGYSYTIINLGLNDLQITDNSFILREQYYYNLKNIVEQLKADNQLVLLSTLNSVNDVSRKSSLHNQTYLNSYNDVIRRVSFDTKVGYVDIFNSIFNGDYNSSLMSDGSHPNAIAHKQINSTYITALETYSYYNCEQYPTTCYSFSNDISGRCTTNVNGLNQIITFLPFIVAIFMLGIIVLVVTNLDNQNFNIELNIGSLKGVIIMLLMVSFLVGSAYIILLNVC